MIRSPFGKFVTRVLLVALGVQLAQPAAYAQQASAGQAVPVTTITPGGDDPRQPLPHLRTFLWTNPGTDRLVPEHMVPKFGKGNEQDDAEAIQCVVLNLNQPGICHKDAHVLWQAGLTAINDGVEFEPAVMEEIRQVVRYGQFPKTSYSRGYAFYGAMAWGGRANSGKYEVVSKGRPVYNSDQPLNGYLITPIRPKRSGPYIGKRLAIFISDFCFNPVLELVDAEVTAALPVEPPPPAPPLNLQPPPQVELERIIAPPPVAVIRGCDSDCKKGGFPWWGWALIGGGVGLATWALLTNDKVSIERKGGGPTNPGTRPTGGLTITW